MHDLAFELLEKNRRFQDLRKFKESIAVYVENLAEENSHSKAHRILFLAEEKNVAGKECQELEKEFKRDKVEAVEQHMQEKNKAVFQGHWKCGNPGSLHHHVEEEH